LNITDAFQGLESRAEFLQASQALQADTQARIHQQMEIDMQIAQGLIRDVAESATDLHLTVQETSTKIKDMVSMHWIIGSLIDWKFALIVLCLVYQLRPFVAKTISLALGRAFPAVMGHMITDCFSDDIPDAYIWSL